MTMTSSERGYAMAALLVGLSVMAILASVALPVWRTAAQREREAELIFRGEQYAHAIELYSRRNGGYPASLDVLEKGKFIRKLYKDPVADDADFQPVYIGQMIAGQPVAPRQAQATGAGGNTGQPPPPATGARGGRAAFQPIGQPSGQPLGQTAGRGTINGGPIIGVISTSPAESIALYNGRGKYNEWAFVATEISQQAGAPNAPQAPGPGQRGRQAGPRGNPFGTPPNPLPSRGGPQPR
jgi:type II secretory pathway pseudopilin PulG